MLAVLLLLPIAFALSVREIPDTPIPMIPDAPPRNVTTFVFPTARDWFTLNETNYIVWDWVQDNSPDLRVILDRPDGDVVMLRGPLILNDKIPANMFGMTYNGSLPAVAGNGYRLRLHDFANDTIVYASSENFEIKVAGSHHIAPMPWGVPMTTTGSSGVRMGSGAGMGLGVVGLLVALL
ncbi:hypothetical protein CcaverHIS002_0407610 [Cutaneotrichosporon cavernicola]|uniref:Uncharacterized protein n=1 Tax=Cutaneotrichosporon cavernicola TaxID=279322 RepID=A0AA48L4S1_9TREE|nr:uncharacterized protein CcaverHIS019_0407600 [Cutaneotrichosporon cavernicola]BEI84157.1 hypothetical protein CcaverHIS002_0407610 [Cutaneotrichosporon cavernicola]BEI91940.1 hypothetical protein CcaverHIS019_0407600 [Cutaneotrichosporon cavernicola]BEI99711.1 hypothetical protein CcaverHIS631_0407540 [Cutaneotrichosporon cavernicola]BEJ07486.1 hypothetical protein CcaverHIS641_0407550 [Cutaneotrichosporon cavernicola]